MKRTLRGIVLGLLFGTALTVSAQISGGGGNIGGGAGIVGGTCTNSVVTAISPAGVPTCTATPSVTSLTVGSGAAGAPSVVIGQASLGFFQPGSGYVGFNPGSTDTKFIAGTSGIYLVSGYNLGWTDSATDAYVGSADVFIRKFAAKSITFDANGSGGSLTLFLVTATSATFSGTIASTALIVGTTPPATGAVRAGTEGVNSVGNIQLNGQTALSPTAPTIASGGCTSPAITDNNGTESFKVTLGSSCSGVTTFTLTMPAAAHRWSCNAHDLTTPATYKPDMTAAASTTAVVITNYNRTTGLAVDFVAAEVLQLDCHGG